MLPKHAVCGFERIKETSYTDRNKKILSAAQLCDSKRDAHTLANTLPVQQTTVWQRADTKSVSYLRVEKQPPKELPGLVQASFQIHGPWNEKQEIRNLLYLEVCANNVAVLQFVNLTLYNMWNVI